MNHLIQLSREDKLDKATFSKIADKVIRQMAKEGYFKRYTFEKEIMR